MNPARHISRTVAIFEAIKRHLEQRKALYDAAEDLGEVTFTVRLQAGTTTVRSVNVSEERIVRRA